MQCSLSFSSSVTTPFHHRSADPDAHTYCVAPNGVRANSNSKILITSPRYLRRRVLPHRDQASATTTGHGGTREAIPVLNVQLGSPCPVKPSSAAEVRVKGERHRLVRYLYEPAADHLARLFTLPLPSSSFFTPCLPSGHRGGKRTRSRPSSHLCPDPELNPFRQMAQLDHGDPLWFVARKCFIYVI